MCKKEKMEYPNPDPSVFDALNYLMRMHIKIHTDDRRNTLAGHWINEAFVVRLWAILEAHHFVHEINQEISGWRAVDICRRLRHEIAHSTGEVIDKKAKKLQEKITEYFRLDDQESIFDDKFILSKSTVLRPMHADCISYCKELLSQRN
jgi:hypothetical protein